MSLKLDDLRVHIDAPMFPGDRYLGMIRDATVGDLVEVLKEQGATIEVVGEPGYVEKDGWVEPGSYLVFRLVNT